MTAIRFFVIMVFASLVLSACSTSSADPVKPSETAANGTDSDRSSPQASPSTQTSLFTEVQSGGSIIQAYTYNDKLENAVFRKHASLPYGVYVPEFMDQRDIPDGVEWGYGEPRNSFAIMDGSLFRPDYPNSVPDLTAYKEYLGSDLSDRTMEYDYFSYRGETTDLIIRFAYSSEEKEKARKLFLDMIASIRETRASKDFEPGVFLTYDESTLDETEKEVLQCALESMDAIIAKDAKAFEKSLYSKQLAEALSFFIDEGKLYRFERLDSITALDEKRYNVNVVFTSLSKAGFLFNSGYAFTVLKNKAGEWKVANID